MAKVLTFSRVFPAYHPRKGEETQFVGQIWNALKVLQLPLPKIEELSPNFLDTILPMREIGCKYHTIRAGHRFKVGDKFSPRVWSGKPYASKQITIAQDIEVKKVWYFDIDPLTGNYLLNGVEQNLAQLKEIATNDGLEIDDFECWFPKSFRGQIICWNEKIDY